MYKVDIPLDTKEAAAINRRRNAEEERKKRIFNPKERLYGKDLEALKQQIDEKRARCFQEAQRDLAYQQEANRQDLLKLELERRLRQNKIDLDKSLDYYRLHCQKFEDRREFDLNDPDHLRKSYPARLHDEDVRCGPASLQRFEGEDLSYKERLMTKVLQNRAWLDAQVNEKRMSKAEYERAAEVYHQRLREIDLRTCQLYQAELEAATAVKAATAHFNRAMHLENLDKAALEKRAEEEAKMAHIVNMCNSELLTESTDSTQVNGPHGVSRVNFKGFNPEMTAMIREEQRRQMLDKKSREKEEKAFDLAWDKLKKREDIAAQILLYETEMRKRDVKYQADITNLELAREQRMRQEYLNRVLYTNSPTEEFFNQFNTSTR